MAKKKKKSTSSDGRLVIAANRKARRDYEILDTFEAGISLKGSEVKSIREGSVNLKDSYVKVSKSEVFLVGCHISPFSHSPVDAHDVTRDRKLLLHRKEIDKLAGRVKQDGLSIVPLQLYFKNGRCKLEIGLGKGKKLHDKRQDVKKKTETRRLEKTLKRVN